MKAPDRDLDPDWDLIERVGRREAPAARELVAKKLPRLLSLATRLLGDRDEANDVAQDVFLRVWREAARWQPGTARFDTWLHRVALNLCYDRLRRVRRRATDTSPDALESVAPYDAPSDAPVSTVAEALDPAPRPDEVLAASVDRRRVRMAIENLPARQREALVLQYYEECSNVEAAQVMGISVDALESLLARARRTLRIALAVPTGASDSQGSDPVENSIRRKQRHDDIESTVRLD
jgi:RNA polymerase sigma-70 factor (ECF subfamily)